MRQAMLIFSGIRRPLGAIIILVSLYAIWIPSPTPPATELKYGRIEIMKLFRNIDKYPDAKLGFYFIYHFNNKIQRSPETGFIMLAKTKNHLLNDSLIVTNETPWNTMSIEIRDNRDQLVGSIGFDSKLNVFYGKSHCTAYPFRLEDVYPYAQYPTYAPPRSERIKCVGSGDHCVELTLRMLDR